jgi:hypothetical protein
VQEVGCNGRVIGVEPILEACEAARVNAAAHQAWCSQAAQQRSPATPAFVNAAVGKRLDSGGGGAASVRLYYYPRALGWSTLAPDPDEVRSNMAAYLDGALSDSIGSQDSGLVRACIT